jgi:membrane fusion protein (multidrug efflux system)
VNTSKAQLTQAQGQLQVAKASAVQTKVSEHQFDTDLATVEHAKAALEEARLNLSYTTIVAPITGRVGKKTVEEGQRIEPGQPLMTIVSDNPWVVANYKETQLAHMRAGQKVDIKIDSFPDHKFEGYVLSFSPASGQSFAVLPSDNATGNFTKIVQRLPVKILFTADSIRGYEDRLAPGLSVISTVDVSQKPVEMPQLAQAK